MVRRFTITLDGDTAERLTEVARAERRDPRDQAALILERVLGRGRRTPVADGATVMHLTPQPPRVHE